MAFIRNISAKVSVETIYGVAIYGSAVGGCILGGKYAIEQKTHGETIKDFTITFICCGIIGTVGGLVTGVLAPVTFPLGIIGVSYYKLNE